MAAALSDSGYGVHEATTVDAALEARALTPDVVAMHRAAASARDLALLRKVAEELGSVGRVLVVGRKQSPIALRRALRDGIDGYLLEDQIETALVATVDAVRARQVVFPSEHRSSVGAPALSHREKQVLALAARGLQNGEIAEQLFLTTSTVKTHLSSAFSKLGVASRSEAAALVFDSNGSLGRSVLAASPPTEPGES
jgi:DNA-binding NarL/FixJ family response regulator